MPVNKNAAFRYEIIDKQLQREDGTTIDEIIKECEYNFIDAKKSTIYKDLKDLEEFYGNKVFSISTIKLGNEYRKRYTDPHFSLSSLNLSKDEKKKLSEVVSILSRFKGMPNYDGIADVLGTLESRFNVENSQIIEFEQNPRLTNLDKLGVLINATINKTPLLIDYKKAKSDLWLIHPYMVKQYSNRWYLIGYNATVNDVSIAALDRMTSVEPQSDVEFIPNETNDLRNYFKDIIGVTNKEECPVEEVRLKFSDKRTPYVESKPLHSTQKSLDNNTFSIKVKENPELVKTILSYGIDVEVLSPQHLRDKIAGICQKMNDYYHPIKKPGKDK